MEDTTPSRIGFASALALRPGKIARPPSYVDRDLSRSYSWVGTSEVTPD